MISKIKDLLKDIQISKATSTYKKIFEKLIPLLTQEFHGQSQIHPLKTLGRPRTTDVSKIFEAIFYIARCKATGIQFSEASDIFKIPPFHKKTSRLGGLIICKRFFNLLQSASLLGSNNNFNNFSTIYFHVL